MLKRHGRWVLLMVTLKIQSKNDIKFLIHLDFEWNIVYTILSINTARSFIPFPQAYTKNNIFLFCSLRVYPELMFNRSCLNKGNVIFDV